MVSLKSTKRSTRLLPDNLQAMVMIRELLVFYLNFCKSQLPALLAKQFLTLNFLISDVLFGERYNVNHINFTL